ncbi:MAG: SNF2-related protein [Ruminococcus sp.]|nr:SNF2-related protein [Ruminococcus sp.]
MDKDNPYVRKYLAERAELLGAIRLPGGKDGAFKDNAGTEVTSDIIFLQKRENPISIEENSPEWIYKGILSNGIAVNKYFADHPEMILGEMVEGNKLYGNQAGASMCMPIDGADLKQQLAEAVKNISGTYRQADADKENSPVGKKSEALNEIPCPPNTPKYSFSVQDDILYYHKSGNTMEKYNAPAKNIECIKAMTQLRDSVHNLLELQLDNINGSLETAITEAQENLNKQYDDFSKRFGLVGSAENKKLFRDDNGYHLIKSLEKLDKDGNFIGKADIFFQKTVSPKIIVDHCDNANDALILSLSEKCRVDLEYMSVLTGKTEDVIIAELGNKIYQNPQKQMRWESADEYLTGNVRSKLAAAETLGLERNAEALRAVIPEKINAADISVKLGSAWVDPDYIRQFIAETLKPDYQTSKRIDVRYSEATDKWKVDGYKSAYSNTLATETYGTADMNAYEIIEATLNMKKAEVRERVKDSYGRDVRDEKGRYIYVTNQEKTMVVQAKQDELKRKFSEWIFADPVRRETLESLYNEKFNSVRLREYDGSNLNFVGMNAAITLKDHQKNAVARDLYSEGNTLLAHEVGAGKTFEMIAIAMEGKRLGLHSKSLIAVPNALTEQWGDSFRILYPNANVLVATEKDFKKENRRDLFAKIATGDWDAVIIGHSQLDMIHLSKERELDTLYAEVDKLQTALEEMLDENGKRTFSVKQVEKSIKSYEGKIEKLLSKTAEDDTLCFEKLGIDKMFIDESQNYKNLDTPTKMQNVSGIGSGGSGKSMQLLMKCKYLDEITGGKGTVFASGTPVLTP